MVRMVVARFSAEGSVSCFRRRGVADSLPMHRNVLFFGLVSVTALLGSVAACSSTTTTETIIDGGTPASESDAAATQDSGKDTSTIEDDDAGTTNTDPDTACAKETTPQACGQCCIGNHPSGSKVFQDSLLACACTGAGADGGAPCATQCAATACAATPMTPDSSCSACLQGSIDQTGACNAAVGKDCTASSDCLAQQKCISTCPNQ